MDEPTFSTLAQRLDRLEREVRWWKRPITIVGGLAVSLVLLLGTTVQPVPDEIRAKRFALVDSTGRTRAKLHVDENDGTILDLLSASGGPRITLHAYPKGAVLSVQDEDKSGVRLWALDGYQSLELDTTKSGNASISVAIPGTRDLPGLPKFPIRNTLLTLEVQDGKPSIELSEASGTSKAVLGHTKLIHPATGVIEEHPPSSIVFIKDGKVIWKAP